MLHYFNAMLVTTTKPQWHTTLNLLLTYLWSVGRQLGSFADLDWVHSHIWTLTNCQLEQRWWLSSVPCVFHPLADYLGIFSWWKQKHKSKQAQRASCYKSQPASDLWLRVKEQGMLPGPQWESTAKQKQNKTKQKNQTMKKGMDMRECIIWAISTIYYTGILMSTCRILPYRVWKHCMKFVLPF